MSDCIFCKIVNRDIPCHKIWEDNNYLAFLSIFPNTDGFSVVIPKKHIDSIEFQNVPEEELIGLTIAAKKAAKKLELAFEDVKRVALICEGEGVDHLHMKLYPMHIGDQSATGINTFFEKYPGYVSSNGSTKCDIDKIKSIADKIRDVS